MTTASVNLKTVSYTHLDVYKRQLLYILIKPLLLRRGERRRNLVDGFWKRYFQLHRTDQAQVRGIFADKMCIRDRPYTCA